MAKIAATPAPRHARRVRVPDVRWSPVAVAALSVPVVVFAPTPWVQAVALSACVAASWAAGFREGRADQAREVILGLQRDDG